MNIFIGCVMYIGYIICIIASGMFAWDWTEPNNFWGVIYFLFVWSIVGSAISFIWQLICAFLINILEK